jgi:hypothetical protein
MTSTQLDRRADRAEEVLNWRYEQLLQAGYQPRKARLLSLRSDVDLHLAVELVQRGCSHELALLILL